MTMGRQLMRGLSRDARERWLGRLSRVLSIASVAGIALGVAGLLGALMDTGFRPGRRVAVEALALCGWVVIAVIAYRGKRYNEFPRTWAVLTVVALIWAALLLNRAG